MTGRRPEDYWWEAGEMQKVKPEGLTFICCEISLERSLSAHRGTDKKIRQEHDEAQERNGKKDGNGGLAHVDRVMFHMTDFLGVTPFG